MNYGNMIVILLLIIAIVWAVRTIYKSRKNGTGCMGCPHAGTCTKEIKCKK